MITGEFYKKFYLRNLEKVSKVWAMFKKVAGLPQLLRPEQEPVNVFKSHSPYIGKNSKLKTTSCYVHMSSYSFTFPTYFFIFWSWDPWPKSEFSSLSPIGGPHKLHFGTLKKYEGICGTYEGICGKYEEYVVLRPGRTSRPIQVGFSLDECLGTWKNSELHPLYWLWYSKGRNEVQVVVHRFLPT